jgi:threonine 3-dehydrogenase
MSRPVVLVTGASGEMGHALLPALSERGFGVVALDLAELPRELAGLCREAITGSVLDRALLEELFRRYRPEAVFHLAAVLSTKAERDPELAHRVNVEATFELFRLCREAAARADRDVRFLFPSSIAVYGFPDEATKRRVGAVKETEWTTPTAIYGCNKLYCETVGAYWTGRDRREGRPGLDFRAIRFPGLVSAETVPTGGTSDYGPEMIHAAALGKPYACFVREDTRLPFMTMPDAVEALLRLFEAPGGDLSTRSYNIRAFSPSAGEIRDLVLAHWPDARISFEPVAWRQTIVDSWPGDVDDTAARRDWGHNPIHGLEEALTGYLKPALLKRYAARADR